MYESLSLWFMCCYNGSSGMVAELVMSLLLIIHWWLNRVGVTSTPTL